MNDLHVYAIVARGNEAPDRRALHLMKFGACFFFDTVRICFDPFQLPLE